MEQEPRHTSTCTLSNENSSDDSSVNKQGLYFIFPPFFLPWPTSSPRVQSSSASKLLWGPRERGNHLLWERRGSKGARGCWSKVKWTDLNLARSRSWLFNFEKVSACLFRLCVGLSPLSGRMGSPAETRAHRGRQGRMHAYLLAASWWTMFPSRVSAWPAGTAIPAEPPWCSSAVQNTAQAVFLLLSVSSSSPFVQHQGF